jgi:hypothetical protein
MKSFPRGKFRRLVFALAKFQAALPAGWLAGWRFFLREREREREITVTIRYCVFFSESYPGICELRMRLMSPDTRRMAVSWRAILPPCGPAISLLAVPVLSISSSVRADFMEMFTFVVGEDRTLPRPFS